MGDTKALWGAGVGIFVFGVILTILEKVYEPDFLVTEQSPEYPNWLSWLRIAMTAAGPLLMIVAELLKGRK